MPVPAAQPKLTHRGLAARLETLVSVKTSGTGSAFQAVPALLVEHLLKHLLLAPQVLRCHLSLKVCRHWC